MENIVPILKSSVSIMLPVFFASLGGLFPALAGNLNIALEGLILMSAFSSFAVFYFTANIAAAVSAGILSAFALCAVLVFAAFRLRANFYICGLAINLLSSGLCIVLSEKIFHTKGVISADFVSDFSGADLLKLFVFLGLFLLFISQLAIYKTPFGFRLRACDKSAASLESLGINVQFLRSASIFISAVFCGISGSFLSLNLGAFVPGMSAGRGWIALAVIFLGVKKPLGILAAAFAFALAQAFSNYAQGFWSIPADFILAFPYVCTLLALIAVSLYPKKNI